jgi:deoxyribonuclease (pyrimidine dimer)|tara:strand:- start:6143 stop:6574 length:432 start_codon:yes stop_codon:yes gene_type:complete
MTRINVGIRAKELCREHLLAEHREIKRTPNKVSKGKFVLKGMPSEFCLGTGHEKFFYDKLSYLKNRYEELYKECCNRGYTVEYYGAIWDNIPISLLGNYKPTKKDRALLVDRINERLFTMQQTYLKKGRSEDVIRLLKYKLYT